jgi:hypothetical protein
MAKKIGNLIGSWAFLIGILLAIITGIITGMNWANLNSIIVTDVLVVIGLIIGLLNVMSKEVTPFLFSGLVLIIAGVFGMSIMITVPTATEILAAMLTIFVPATIIVAIKNVWGMAKN